MPPTSVWERIDLGSAEKEGYWAYSPQDYEQVKAKVYSEDLVAEVWPYDFAEVNIHPTYAHSNNSNSKYWYYSMGIDYTDGRQAYSSKNSVQINTVYDTYNKKGQWYAGYYSSGDVPGALNLNFDSWRKVNTVGLENTGLVWWVGYKNVSSQQLVKTNILTEKRCKFFVVNERQYVGFDCDNNGDFSDLICWIEYKEPVVPFEGKRYMVEDLGGQDHGDFDFNDIVFDVVEIDGQKKCLVRALGGTLDIEIVVGTSRWRKGANEGRDKQFIVTKMYNTENPEIQQEEILDEFDVEGWDPNENNVSVIVYTANGQKYAIEFPEDGDIPLMVATKLTKLWRVEKSPVPSAPAWFMED